MDLRTAILLGGSVTLILTFLLAMGKGRGALTVPEFFFASNRLNLGKVVNLMLSTPFSANGMLYQTFLGYAIGPAAVLTQVAWCASYVWLDRYRPRIRTIAKDRTLHGVIGSRFGSSAEIAAAVATIIGFLMQVGWEVTVGASVFSAGFDGSHQFYWFATLGLATIAAAYTMLGGLRGNATANTAQNAIAVVAFSVAVIFIFSSQRITSQTAGWDSGTFGRMVATLGWVGLVSNMLFSVFWQFVDMSTWQNLAAADERAGQSRATLWGSAFTILLFPGVVGTLLGMYLRGVPDLNPNTILPELLSVVSVQGSVLLLLVCGFFCVMFSTLDGLLLSVSLAGTFDIQKRAEVETITKWYRDHPPVESLPRTHQRTPQIVEIEQSVFFAVRFWILLGAITASALFVWLTQYRGINIFDLVYIVTIAQLALLPCVWVCLRCEDGVRSAGAVSIWSGLVVGIVLVALGIISGETSQLAWAPCVSLAVSTAALIAFARR
jgi:Na+/proline symporter